MNRPIKISAEQRDLLYDRILLHLSGIDGVWLAAYEEDFDTADRLSHEFSDELQLVMDDFGWGSGNGDEPVFLTSPPEVVRRVMERLRSDADASDREEQEQKRAMLEAEERNRLVRETCDQVLSALGDAEEAGQQA